MRGACGQFSFRAALAEHSGKERFWIDAMGCIMRAGIDAAWFLQVPAEIAGSRFLLDDRFLAASIFWIIGEDFKGMKIDVTVGTIASAKAAADTPILDDHFE